MAAPKIKSLSQGYIFYNRLKENPDPEKANLFSVGLNGVNEYTKFYKDKEKNVISANLLNMSSVELTKEQMALQKIFGMSITITDLSDPKQVQMLIEAFNATLGLKSAYERNVARIKKYDKKGQINVASFFSGYFLTAWNERKEDIVNRAKELYNVSNDSSVNEIEKFLIKELNEVSKEALRKMFRSRDITEDSSSKHAYTSLLTAFDQFQGTNQFTQAMAKLYHLDVLSKELTQLIVNTDQQQSLLKNSSNSVKTTMNRGYYTKGGIVLEHLENYIVSAIMNGTAGTPNLKLLMPGSAFHAGGSGMKADNMFVFGAEIDPNIIGQTIDKINHTQTSRENITKEIAVMQEQLSKISEGFIIYSSAKNYISQGTNFAGFSGGTPVSVATMKKITDDKTKMGAILQTVNGAVGDSQREDIKMSIAEDIAYYLFDDFSTIGTPSTGVQALHLFDLDGIYVPLSVLLYKLGKAIEAVREIPTSLLTVSIHNPPSIMFPTDESMTEDAWQQQRQDAAENTKISVAFMKDFFSMIRSF